MSPGSYKIFCTGVAKSRVLKRINLDRSSRGEPCWDRNILESLVKEGGPIADEVERLAKELFKKETLSL